MWGIAGQGHYHLLPVALVASRRLISGGDVAAPFLAVEDEQAEARKSRGHRDLGGMFQKSVSCASQSN